MGCRGPRCQAGCRARSAPTGRGILRGRFWDWRCAPRCAVRSVCTSSGSGARTGPGLPTGRYVRQQELHPAIVGLRRNQTAASGSRCRPDPRHPAGALGHQEPSALVRDVTLAGDRSQVRTGAAPQIMAALRCDHPCDPVGWRNQYRSRPCVAMPSTHQVR